MTQSVTDLTITKAVQVAAPVEHAWEVFTARMADWWPLDTHAADTESTVDARIEDGVLVEVHRDGSTAEWADVVTFEPPHRLVLAWRVNPDRSAPTTIEVTFTASGDGTRVDLVHTGWEALADGAEASANYRSGWDLVLARYPAVVSATR